MTVHPPSASRVISEFIVSATPPPEARARAAGAFRDTIGVILAGASEPAARLVRAMAADEGHGTCHVLGTTVRTSAGFAAMANGAAAHALDYDDMCFVSLAHPSCVLVPAILAAGELTGVPGARLMDAYVVGFEVECRLGLAMNPRHYHQRGWHATSSIGTVGAAAAAARVLGLDEHATGAALGIAASSACGLKENMGTMVKPLHAGLAARNGLTAARLAQSGLTASDCALDGPQGYLAVMDSEHSSVDSFIADLGTRWEILETGITVKLFPSCAATHPALDALLDVRRREHLVAEQIESVEIAVDSMTPRLLLYPRPATELEAKFSMPFCAAAAIVYGAPGIDTFRMARIQEPAVRRVMERVTLRANQEFDRSAPLSRARVTIHLNDGRVLTQEADGARGYPGRLTDHDLEAKFRDCARRALAPASIDRAWEGLRAIETIADVRALTPLLSI
jgi:2-methylcitrate dehydratase PrpD